ncbi:TPA: hypothetical protein ACHCBX_004592 [Vibrio parahaemolyticus]|jgi:hypothetical protein|uniref:hypothetical protein n=1 Tax=Vibrio parahaemolyticus TaxID=670 RepID=UPI00041D33D1|nr:hypothetical protein [Vibrio parahaemolyticus]EGQ7779589.1 hypothetical protein [Vibrio parahaemolyticus]EGQ8400140.1 hypothetical protein [Vibrio parahaemolyticus]EGQ9050370.1 hypothetical protein [Vibrio parahaemolyticus]EGQ9147192.1 hypothetical protein [Vibrio parahaemolyticus]EGQ9589604.1 hypothetical protein [Vibrio parahaemolyticus]
MDKVEFVKAIKEVVESSSVENTIENLSEPPGRSPDKRLLEQSNWFKSLPPSEQALVQGLIEDAVKESVFGMLCVLDGVRPIASSEDSSMNIQLTIGDSLINDTESECLHDIYQNV